MGKALVSESISGPDQEIAKFRAILRNRSNSRRRSSSSRTRQNRLRLVFFGLAALWGFLMGVAALLCCMRQSGIPIAIEPLLYGFLLGAGLLAVVGGLLAAMVYKDAIKRRAR